MTSTMTAVDLTLALEPHVRAAAGGDREAFARLVDASRSLVDSIALAILRDADASRDVAQDVFLAAWRDLGKLRNPDSFLPWLRQMTRNRAHHVLRSRVRGRRVVSDGEADDLLAAATDARPGAGERLLADEERRLLAEAVAALPDEAREVVTLYYREGRSARQVAGLLGMSEDAVKQRLSRARARLRREMLERFGEVAQRTAPGAAFTATVLALTLGSPGAAAAAGLGASKLAGQAGAGLLGKLAALVGGAGLGIAGGIAGVLLGARHMHVQARDDEERRAIRRFAVVASLVTVAGGVGIAVTSELHSKVGMIVSFAAFYVTLTTLLLVWPPRITARRFAAEKAEDPVGFARRQRRDRWLRLAGFLGGLLGGGGALLYAVLHL